jgi:hypothetical protein
MNRLSSHDAIQSEDIKKQALVEIPKKGLYDKTKNFTLQNQSNPKQTP